MPNGLHQLSATTPPQSPASQGPANQGPASQGQTNNSQDPLAALHDIHLPPEISAWPPAPIWWAVLAVLIVGVAVLLLVVLPKLRRWEQRYRQRRQLQRALALEWQALQQRCAGQKPGSAAELHCLLKRVARLRGAKALGMSDQTWLSWLAENDGEQLLQFRDWLLAAPYQANPTIPAGVLQAAEQWVLATPLAMRERS